MPRTNARMRLDGAAPRVPAEFDRLYERMWRPMVLIAIGLVDDSPSAEEVVQDAFTALYEHWSGMRDPQAAAAYLQVSVVNAARAVLRRRRTARKHLPAVREAEGPGADDAVLLSAEHQIAREALATLPDRQREVLTLRYLAALPDDEIAAATGLSLPGVRSASSRGLAAMRAALGGQL
jgi:RNA polymerase sigma factor (sigma-70 family)